MSMLKLNIQVQCYSVYHVTKEYQIFVPLSGFTTRIHIPFGIWCRALALLNPYEIPLSAHRPPSVRRDTEWVFPQEWRVSNLHTSWQNRLWKRFYYFHSKKQLRRNAHRCFIGSMNFLPDCKAKQSLLLAIICNCPATVLAMQGNLKEQLTKHLSQTTLSLCNASCASPTTAAASSDSDRPRRWSEAARARPQSKTIMWHVRRATVKWLESTVQTAHTDHSEVVINGSQM